MYLTLCTPKGFHLEGPFISLDKRGAHNKDYVRGTLSPDAVQDCYHSLQDVCIITLAPELPGAIETICWLKKFGIIVSLGHSAAHLEKAEEGVRSGAKLVTHLFNAMLPVSKLYGGRGQGVGGVRGKRMACFWDCVLLVDDGNGICYPPHSLPHLPMLTTTPTTTHTHTHCPPHSSITEILV